MQQNDHLNRIYLQADDEFRFICHMELSGNLRKTHKQLHAVAVEILFKYLAYVKCRVKEVVDVFTELPQELMLYNTLIAPFLEIVDDRELIARKYGALYLRYISEKSKGVSDEEAVKRMFELCSQSDCF